MGTVRFLLSVTVLMMHSSPIFGYAANIPGYLAVQLFYIISGFLMTFVYSERYVLTAKPYYYFITNRFYKLFPLYWITILLIIAFSISVGIFSGSYNKLQYYYDYYQKGNSLWGLVVVGLSNFTLVFQDVISFFTITPNGLAYNGLQANLTLQELFFIPIAWTVSVEIIFYLVTPFIATKSIKTILIFISLILLCRLLLYSLGVNNGFIIYRFAPTEFLWYLLGVLSYKLYHKKMLPDTKWAMLLFTIVMVTLLIIPRFGYITDIALYSLIFLSAGALVNRFTHNKWDKILGELSYPIYIVHTFVLSIVVSNAFPKKLETGLSCLILSLALSVILNEFVLKKIESFRKNRILK